MLGWIRLARAPGSAIAIVVMLALGIGAATAAFSLAAAVWLNPLPYPHSRQLVNLWLRNRNYPDLYDGLDGTAQELKRELPGLAQVAPYETGEAVCRVRGRRAQLGVALVSPGFFPLLGLAPAQGRFFRNTADDAAVAAPESGLGVGENITCAGQTYR
ncbi:MAG: ABC transporter permease, partial [Terriglobales bacterium]